MKKYLKDYHKLIEEYSFDKNKDINFESLTYGSAKKVWWKCKTCESKWIASIRNRIMNKSGCPFCSNHRVNNSNSLHSKFPDLLKEWDYDKNKLKPKQVVAGSRKKVWWKCFRKHEWQQRIDHRTFYGTSCPYCSNRKVCKDNCLTTTHPELAKEWSNKNKFKPTEVTYGSRKKVWWKCHKGHEWKTLICERQKYNCPYCSNRKVCKDNCLATTHPELVKEWSSKNKLKPTEVTYGSYASVKWECSKGHKWESKISARTTKKHNCPYCSNQKVCKDNCLATTHPELAKEWSSKNKLKPTEITAGSTKKIWWTCKRCSKSWQSVVFCRKRGQGCPGCNESVGERLISETLEKFKIRYKKEYKFEELGQKRFDFALFDKWQRKPFAVIEYHGEQHYRPVRFGGMSLAKAKDYLVSCKKRDKIKKQYCIDNNIKYLEIPYWKKDNIEKLIRDFMK